MVECGSFKPAVVGSSPSEPFAFYGIWRSLVAWLLWVQFVGGSNPPIPLEQKLTW